MIICQYQNKQDITWYVVFKFDTFSAYNEYYRGKGVFAVYIKSITISVSYRSRQNPLMQCPRSTQQKPLHDTIYNTSNVLPK